VLNAIEADSFWCLSRLLDGIQDNYIFAQPGIQRSVRRMAELVGRIDGISLRPSRGFPSLTHLYAAPLSAHLESQNVEFMQFAFRWMNCLLMREISVQNTIRMWDTYLVRTTDHHISPCYHRLSTHGRRKAQTHFRNFICTCVLHFW
jgi:hypothetical protein